MTLIRIEKFTGSILGNVVEEALEQAQIITALNVRQYSFSINGIQEETPKGFIEDEPKSHRIQINKVAYVGKKVNCKFVKGETIDTECESYKKCIDKYKKLDLNFGVSFGNARIEERTITLDRDGCWYRHSFEIVINQESMTQAEYIAYMFNTIANMIVDNN